MTHKFSDYFSRNNLVPRQPQLDICNRLDSEWDNYKYFIVDAPVGVGKTHIALAISEKSKNSYVLTSTKMLQEQYELSSAALVSLMGRSNYQCAVDPAFSCDAAPCVADKNLLQKCISQNTCPYYNQKYLANRSQSMITNYTYFLHAAHYSADDDDAMNKRECIIMDEAHELDNHLVSFASVEISLAELRNTFAVDTGTLAVTEDEGQNVKMLIDLTECIAERVDDMKQDLATMFGDNKKSSKSDALKNIAKAMANKIKAMNTKVGNLERIKQRLEIYLETSHNSKWLLTPNVIDESIGLAPLTADRLFDAYVADMADKFIFMSASIGPPEVFAKELGININEICVIKTGTPFDASKSPITLIPCADLSYRNIDKNMPTVINAIATIMDHHSGDKGIIHAGNYRITNETFDNIPIKHRRRLLSRDMHAGTGGWQNKKSNVELLEMHAATDDPTVLISPSMTTGVDLVGDAARFQIIVKLPYLSLGDPRVKKKANLDSRWYSAQMFITLLQSTGRATRDTSDHSTTYILDQGIIRALEENMDSLPGWFLDRVAKG